MERALDGLAELRQRGFQFMNIHDGDGQLDQIMGFRQLRGYVDTLMFRSVSDARACRTPAAQRSTRSTPAVWSFEGGLAETIDRLLELPLPGTPLAPILAKRSVPDLTLAGMNPFQLWTPPGQIA